MAVPIVPTLILHQGLGGLFVVIPFWNLHVEVNRFHLFSQVVLLYEILVLLEPMSIAVSNEERKTECVPGLRNEGESGEDEFIGNGEVEEIFAGMDAEGAVEVFEDQGDEFVGEVRRRHGVREEELKRDRGTTER